MRVREWSVVGLASGVTTEAGDGGAAGRGVGADGGRGDEPGKRAYDVSSRLLKDRIVFLGTAVDDGVANVTIAQMLFLEHEDPGREIRLSVNLPGGSVTAGLAIYDAMQAVRCDVSTRCLGMGASLGRCRWRGDGGAAVRAAERAADDPPGGGRLRRERAGRGGGGAGDVAAVQPLLRDPGAPHGAAVRPGQAGRGARLLPDGGGGDGVRVGGRGRAAVIAPVLVVGAVAV